MAAAATIGVAGITAVAGVTYSKNRVMAAAPTVDYKAVEEVSIPPCFTVCLPGTTVFCYFESGNAYYCRYIFSSVKENWQG